MPYSSTAFKDEVKLHIIENLDSNTKILDVGPGAGTYGKLLREHFTIDGLEIFEPYINKFNLNDIYHNVFVGNILAFDILNYDYIILGDILEHIPKYEAVDSVNRINYLEKKCLIAVPYLYEQGEYDGNIHETHHQADLTHEIFLNRYPSMHLLFKDDGYGYYINYDIVNKIYFDDDTFIWKTKLNLYNKKFEILESIKPICSNNIDKINYDNFKYKYIECDYPFIITNDSLLDDIQQRCISTCINLYNDDNKSFKINSNSWINIVRASNPIQPAYENKKRSGELLYHDHLSINKSINLFTPVFTYVYYIQMPDILNGEDGVLYFKNSKDERFHVLPKEDELIIMLGDVKHVPNDAPSSNLDRIVFAGNIGFINKL
jgi:hypothetical protein